MIILEYRCEDCLSFFETAFSLKFDGIVKCVSCGRENVLRVKDMRYCPNKHFCPNSNKFLDVSRDHLVGIRDVFSENLEICTSCK
jgi:predicted RNA-binding Zn-ribbon protein involved in translation (DUF1610 family)